jgi:hypothetical protein
MGDLVGAAVGEDVNVGFAVGGFVAAGPMVDRFVGGGVVGILVGGADTGGVVEGSNDCAPARGIPPRSVSNSDNASAGVKNELILRRLEEYFFSFESSSSPLRVRLEDASELGGSNRESFSAVAKFIRNSGLCGNLSSCVNETMQILQPDNLQYISDWFASALPVKSPSFIVCLWWASCTTS